MAKPAKKKVEKAKRPKAVVTHALPAVVEAPAKNKVAKAKSPKASATVIKVLAAAPVAKPVKLAKAVRQIEKRLLKPAHDSAAAGVLERLWSVIEQRRVMGDAATSHSARLLARGTQKVAQKLGEEAVELVIEAVARNREATISESADLLYHLLVLWVDASVAPDDVWRELCRREGISGIAEKAARPKTITRLAKTRKLP
ncbi:phosphoribosyl-ATP diphosphatase [Rhodovarius sp.]|uniref:phosphoribosyl-ATP diphosphatase n=1 Tax=Rhodovarius sp. TaxID=2972673 RepID=UPI003342870B